MNLRGRVAIGGAVIVVAAVALVGAIEYPAIGAGLRANTDADLVAIAADAPATYKKLMAVESAENVLGDGNPSSKISIGKDFIELIRSPVDGQADKVAPVGRRDVQVAQGSAPPYFADVRSGGVLYRVYTTPIPGHPGALVRAATPESDPTGTLNRLAWLLVLLTPAAGLLAAVGARLLAARVLSPVARLTAAAERIAATGDLSAPIAVSGRDEVARLGLAFNAMTGALDGSVGAQRRLVADASHELRTPLTSLVTNLELLAERPDDPQAPALIGEALDQARRLSLLTGDLVDLARFGEPAARDEAVRMDLLCAELAAQRGASVSVSDSVPGSASVDAGSRAVVVRGDPAAWERAVGNLVDNALKFGTQADIAVRAVVGYAVIEVGDDGPGIPDADLPYVFDRFHRSPDARSLPGSGLGLAIAKQVAEAHGGRIEAVPRPVGVLLRITVPIAAAQ
ncbi:two-component system sensor histidine kinase MprB [Catenulispora sp. MAP5-51]|uniref:HAMP domain-containing sensor histidine kinase n=1 Tax=Catenulispora sp. MAP5-51 TaxID=3156298 RepID=UPI00351186DC